MKSIAKKYFLQYAGLSKGAWRGAFISLVQSSFGGICFFLSLYFVNTLGFSIAVAGTIMSCYGLGTITGGIISGKLSDKIDPFSILAVSVLSQGMFFLCLIDCNGILSSAGKDSLQECSAEDKILKKTQRAANCVNKRRDGYACQCN